MINLIIIIAEKDSVSKVHEQTRYPETTRTLMLDLLAGMENIRVGRKSLFIHDHRSFWARRRASDTDEEEEVEGKM